MFRLDISQPFGRADRLTEFLVIPIFRVGGVVEIQPVDGWFSALNGYQFHRNSRRVEYSQWMHDLRQIEARRLAAIAFRPVVCHHDQDWFHRFGHFEHFRLFVGLCERGARRAPHIVIVPLLFLDHGSARASRRTVAVAWTRTAFQRPVR